MDKEMMYQVIQMIAHNDQKSEQDIYEIMQESITHAYYSEDQRIREQWKEIPSKGDVPTPEEFVDYLMLKLHK